MSLPKIKDFTDFDHYPSDPQPTTDADMQDYMQNQNDILAALTKRLWQPQTEYKLGDIVASDTMADGLVAVCTIAGVTSDIEPTWGVNEATVIDNSCTWIMRPAYCYGLATERDVDTAYEGGSVENSRLMSMGIFSRLMACVRLLAYPVGSLYWSKNSTDPATLFGGTWTRIKDKFILAAGDSYAVGATGGSASVALTIAQLPAHNHSGSAQSNGSHNHSASSNSTGEHTHVVSTTDGIEGNGNGAQYNDAAHKSKSIKCGAAGSHSHTITVNSAGAHTHNLTINNTGSGQAHENMPPYVTYYCWERTA